MQNETFNEAVGRRIRARRKLLNYTQEKVADKIGITFQQIQKYEKGTNGCSAKRISDLARVLNVSILYFFFDNYNTPMSYEEKLNQTTNNLNVVNQ